MGDEREVILLSSDDEAVARLPSPRSRARLAADDSSDVEVVEGSSPFPTSGRKRVRCKTESVERVQVQMTPLPPTPLAQVLDVFADVSLDHVRKLLAEHNNVAVNVINALIEGGSYPKEPRQKPPTVAPVQEPTYDFMSASSFEPTEGYKKDSIEQLLYLFPCLTKSGAKFFMGKSSNHFAIAHDKIVRCLRGQGKAHAATLGDDDPEVRQFKKLKACTVNKAQVDEEQKKEFETLFGGTLKKTFFSARPRAKHVTVTDPILIQEVAHVRAEFRKWEDQVESGIIRKENRELSIKEGTAVECACCFDRVAMDEMVQCRNEGHLFCQDCLASYVENQVFSNGNFGVKPGTKEPALELMCFHGDGCGSGFERFFLVKALKEKVLERYDELLSQVNLQKAGLVETVCSCPSCGLTAELPASVSVFVCPKKTCAFESCRHCKEASHVPLRCHEVEKKKQAEGRMRVEEAASAAVIRFCPKCKKGIIKSDGCNKMTCSCGVKFCYLCRTIVQDYSHFCQIPHCTHTDPKTCNHKCPLYTNDLDAVHEKNMRDAALAEAAKVEAETAAIQPTKVGLFGKLEPQPAVTVRIDVDSILQAPGKRR